MSPLSAFQLESPLGNRKDSRQPSDRLSKASCSQLSTAVAAWPAGLGLSPTAFIPGLGGGMGILTAVMRDKGRVPAGSVEGISCAKGLQRCRERQLKRLVQQTVGEP